MLAACQGYKPQIFSRQKQLVSRQSRLNAASGGFVTGPTEPVPDYTELDNQPLNKWVLNRFRNRIVTGLNMDSEKEGYDGLMELVAELNTRYETKEEVQQKTRELLVSLFPAWIPPMFVELFAKPFPQFSLLLNAYVTALTCQWLMGEAEVNDIELPDGTVGKNQGVLVKRCRFLESAGCVSVCLNSCKIPTQEFFKKDFGLDVTLEPNYEDYSCQFCFGKKPLPLDQDEAFNTPCIKTCTMKAKKSASQCPGGDLALRSLQ
eukprot:TRINITY_DN18150_c0_g2_i1.p1 TRINITY_DN18150_c0_g2~~TRINITY_DN18150_c0_g2_i1.p1  ORF type:complete len:262 (+),score=29.77 TRINITY_DN18150_c0_g2_i1:41-826(+)